MIETIFEFLNAFFQGIPPYKQTQDPRFICEDCKKFQDEYCPIYDRGSMKNYLACRHAIKRKWVSPGKANRERKNKVKETFKSHLKTEIITKQILVAFILFCIIYYFLNPQIGLSFGQNKISLSLELSYQEIVKYIKNLSETWIQTLKSQNLR